MSPATTSSPWFTGEICILAGGLSKRMGRDKARLRLGSRTLVGHIRCTVRVMGYSVRVIRQDRVPRCGPLGGVYTALATTECDAVLFLACDMPFVGTEALRCVLDKHTPQGNAVFTSYGNQVGFPFVLPRRAIEKVAIQLERREFSLQDLARSVRAKIIKVPQKLSSQLRNVNTRSDWKTAKKHWNRRNCKL